MTKKTCNWLNKNELSGMQIRNDGNMYPCAIRWIPLSNEPSKYKDYKNLTLDDIQELRVKMSGEINEGKHQECQNCPLLHNVSDGEDSSVGPIKHLIYHPHTLCTLDCKYCFYTSEQKSIPISPEYEDVYENIKHFYDIGLLNKEQFCLDLGGGEPTLLKNIDKTIEFMSNTWENSTFCLMSNSTVTDKVNELIASLKGKYNNVKKCLITSIDCGTAKTYADIRRKDYYYQVANNLYNYVKNNVFDEVLLKYIFLDDLSNADDDNIFGFLHLCKYLDMVNKDVIKISLDVDWQKRKHTDGLIPDEILRTIARMYYFITEILKIDYYFASDYLNESTQNGKMAVEKILKYSKEYVGQTKTERELYETEVLQQNCYNIVPPKCNCIKEKSIKDKLQIAIITYNRKEYLERTLAQLLSKESPVKDFDITILDNASTDGTSELAELYSQKYPNLTHVRHSINIGGNGNVIKAFELAIASGKEYFWGLCDDDKYDFSNWKEVENCIEQKKDIICLSNYGILYNNGEEPSLSDKLMQMTFFPAGIYRTDLLESNVLMNMTYSISDCFPHMCATIHAINQNKEIYVLSEPVVFNGLHCNKQCSEISYTRGAANTEKAIRLEYSSWILGYANILNLLQRKRKFKKELFCKAILHNEVYGNWENFYHDMFYRYLDKRKYNYLFEIFYLLPIKHTFKFLFKSIFYKFKFHKETYKSKDDWTFYFEKRHYQKKIDKLAQKLNGKKILLYGNGMISQVLQENYDLSNLNIVAVTDRKLLGCDSIQSRYTKIAPNKLGTIDYDVILLAVAQGENIKKTFTNKGCKKEIVKLIR